MARLGWPMSADLPAGRCQWTCRLAGRADSTLTSLVATDLAATSSSVASRTSHTVTEFGGSQRGEGGFGSTGQA